MLDPGRQVPPLQPHVQRRVYCALVYEPVTSSSAPLQSDQENQTFIVPALVTQQCPEPHPATPAETTHLLDLEVQGKPRAQARVTYSLLELLIQLLFVILQIHYRLL